MKLIVAIALLLCAAFLRPTVSLDADDYVAYVEELSRDEKFMEEYSKWSLELFSQPDYLYGGKHNSFPCARPNDTNVPTSVHTLRPSDIKCVGAMGDSLTAALGAHAITPIGLLFENRGVSWSVGGDHKYKQLISLPNALREYKTDVQGFSTEVSVIFLNGQNATHNHLNVAKSGDRSNNMPYQAELLLSRFRKEKSCDWEKDWKLVTLFVGGNDLCSFCEDPNVTKHTPEQYMSYVRDALDKLYNARLPRTLINLVLVLDVRSVKELNSGGLVCQLLHKRTCPCAAFPTPEQAKILDDYVPRYHQVLNDLVSSGRYDGRDDFAVVVQPFLSKTKLPHKDNHKIDFSYFAPDCFHFSGKGHAQAALSLWNNMLEPVGGKQVAWHINETLKCPTAQYPYIFTKKNSAKALEEYQRSTRVPAPTEADVLLSSSSSSTSEPEPTTTRHHHHKRPKGEKSSSSFTSKQFAVIVAMFFMMMGLLVLTITKRQQISVFVRGAGQRHLRGFTNPDYTDDNDDFEVWNRADIKSSSADSAAFPKTHGARMTFE